MFLLSSNKAVALTPTTKSLDRPSIFLENTSGAVNCWDVAEYLKQAEIVAIGKLVKTSSGYSPILISKEYAEDEVDMLSDLQGQKLDVITRASMMSSLEKGLFILDRVPFGMILAALQIFFETDLSVFYNHLLDHEQARADGFFFIEGTLNGLVNVSEKSMLVDGRDMETAWCMLLPHDITSDELVPIIKKNFSAICGLLKYDRSKDDYSVFFFSKQYFPAWMDDSDYRHCISHIIDRQGLEGYITPCTHEMNRRTLIEKLMELTDPSLSEFDDDKIHELNTLLVKEKGQDPNELLSLEDVCYNEQKPHIVDPFCGTPYTLNIHSAVQVEACSKIMRLGIEDTMMKLVTHSAPEIQEELMVKNET